MHGASHVAALMNAVKASGVVVRVQPAEFMAVLKRSDAPLVVVAQGGVFSKKYLYLTSYKGLAFHTKSVDALVLPPHTEIIAAEKMSIPEL